jgi:hypothetical protein
MAVSADVIERDKISHRKFRRPEALEGPVAPLPAPEIPERDGHSRDPYDRRLVPWMGPKFLMAASAGHPRSGRSGWSAPRTRRQHGEKVSIVDTSAASQLGAVVNDAAGPGADQRPAAVRIGRHQLADPEGERNARTPSSASMS